MEHELLFNSFFKNRFTSQRFFKKILILLMLFSFSNSGWAQLPTEDFNSGIPSNWLTLNSGNSTTHWQENPNGYQNTTSAFLDFSTDNIGEGNSVSYYLITPTLTIPDNSAVIKFKVKKSSFRNTGSTLSIYSNIANPTDLSSYTLLNSYVEEDLISSTTNEFVNIVFELPESIAGLEARFALVATKSQFSANPNGDQYWIDDFSVVSDPSAICNFNVNNYAISYIGAKHLVITPTNLTQAYEVQILPSGQQRQSAGLVVTGVHTFDGLLPNTAYDIYIRSICSSTAQSTWTNTRTFDITTKIEGYDCIGAININDYLNGGTTFSRSVNLLDFNNKSAPGQEGITNYWSYASYGNTNVSCLQSGATSGNYVRNNRAFFSYTPSVDQLVNIKLFNTTTGADIDKRNHGFILYEGCNALLNTSSTGTPQPICYYGNGAGNTSTFNNATVTSNNIQLHAGVTYLIVVGNSQNRPTVDINLRLEFEVVQCPIPAEIKTIKLGTNNFSLAWNNLQNMSSSWEVFIQANGLPAPTNQSGTIVTSNYDVNFATQTNGSAILPATKYDVYVKANCPTNNAMSTWSQVYTLTTLCEAVGLPFTDDFTGGGSACWNKVDYLNTAYTWNNTSYNGMYALRVFGEQQHDFLVSPLITINPEDINVKLKFDAACYLISPATSARIRVKAKQANELYLNNTSYFDIDLEVFTLTHAASTSNGFPTFEIPLPDSFSGDYLFTFYVKPTDNQDDRVNWIYLDNVRIESFCAEPTNLTASNFSLYGATLSWEAAASNYEVHVQDRGQGAPGAYLIGSAVAANTYNVTGLQAGRYFEYYVRSVCASGKSNWSGPFVFRTACNEVSIPYVESFNNDDQNTQKYCWDYNGTNITSTNTGVSIMASQTNEDLLITPRISQLNGFHEVKIKHSSTTAFNVEVLFSSTDTTPSSFTTTLATFSSLTTNTSSAYFNFTGQGYIAFKFRGAQANASVSVDEIRILNSESCLSPTALAVQPGSVSTNAATVVWTPAANENQWEVAIVPQSQTPTSGSIVTTPSFTATNLEQGTIYTAYVRSVCSVNDKSGWVGPISFTTSCTQSFVVPFAETFNSDSNSKLCWTNVNNIWNMNNSLYVYEGDYSAEIYTYYNGGTLITPKLISSGSPMRVRFFIKTFTDGPAGYVEDLRVKLSRTGNQLADFDTVLYERYEIIQYQHGEVIINLPTDVTGEFYLALEVPPHRSNTYMRQSLKIDQFVVENIGDCPTPYAIRSAQVNDTNFQVVFDGYPSVSQYQVIVLPEGTAFNESLVTAANTFTGTSSPITVTGLTPSTRYTYYIRPICNGQTGQISEGFDVLTLCPLDNRCEYTFTVDSEPYSGISGQIDVMQNGMVVGSLTASSGAQGGVSTFTMYLCDGVAFNLYWDAIGYANLSPRTTITIRNANGIVWQSQPGIGRGHTNVFTGIAQCGPITCPAPTNLTANAAGNLTWTPGATEAQWEVAIQKANNGTIPQAGTIVSANSYTPVASDFVTNGNSFEYFVRAICSDSDKSIWVGPYIFTKNDSQANAMNLPVSSSASCANKLTGISLFNATSSTGVSASCNVNNGADIWFDFTATSNTHQISLSNFSGTHYYFGQEQLPEISMVVYKVNTDGSLAEVTCSNVNILSTLYNEELEVGAQYKLRLVQENPNPLDYTFDVCLSEIEDPCTYGIVNGSFENPVIQTYAISYASLLDNFIQGWRNNTASTEPNSNKITFLSTTNSAEIAPIYGAQMIHLVDEPTVTDLNNVTGVYQDLNTSEMVQVDYSLVISGYGMGNLGVSGVQIYAGPVGGPYQLIKVEDAPLRSWKGVTGTYVIPVGQNKTRFIFKNRYQYHVMIDGVKITPVNYIITSDQVLSCPNNSVELKAEGYGRWISAPGNPSELYFANAEEKQTQALGFVKPGMYEIIWKTRYCEYSVFVNYEGIAAETTIQTTCVDGNIQLQASPVDGHTLNWYDAYGHLLASGTTYTPQAAGQYVVALTNPEGCSYQTSIVIDDTTCFKFIPKGISPNGDGLNDAFDISGLRAQSVKIYNRHGREVYSHGAGYTNQWYGQTKEGNDLPDATYYYVIKAGNGELFTGWVYISREVR